MLFPTIIARLFVCMTILLTLARAFGAETISPPAHVTFAKDVIINKYTHGQPLNLFTYSGKWKVKAIGNSLSLAGATDKNHAHLLSKDKLSKKPKSFKFDFVVRDKKKEYGFIYGNIGVILIENKMFPAEYNSKTNILKASSISSKIIKSITTEKINTLDINTGYDPTGGQNQVCVIYINGVGIQFDIPNTDNRFGVYLGSQNSIAISSFRWGVGSK